TQNANQRLNRQPSLHRTIRTTLRSVLPVRVRVHLTTLSVQVGLITAGLTFAAALIAGLLMLAVFSGAAWGHFSILMLVSIGCGVIAGLVGYAVVRRLFQPLRQLSESAARLATGDLSTSLIVSGSQEFRTLSRTLDNARHQLDGITRWLTHEKAWAEYLV